MPEASVDPGYGSLRRKVTLACDYCRKKRVKCTGSAPCKLCAENRHPCHFDDRNRNRRGPRPRANSSRPSRICLIAPAPSRPSDRHVDQISSFSGGEYLPSSPNVASSIKNVATNDLDDEDPDSEEDVFPPATEWRGGLLSVLMDPSTPDSLYVSVMPSAALQEQGLRSSAETHLVGIR
ncbi:Activator of stress genes protein 1 [Colletotrichum fructicola]|nr:Activator of stress genes protein 1 [Colletotrichum fructicola]KAF4905603.1 Activator of stress genes protein 1 [Colletotrichum fructicola]KAF4935436.1 Activator of stress genes protein 1 [Colletotrichum fructicola]